MVHIVCEGEKDKFEYKFIDRIVTALDSTASYKIYCCAGKENIPSKFNTVIKLASGGDIIVLVFDNISYNIGKISVSSLLLSLAKRCNKLGIHFRYTDYYCIEEVFLSYSGLFSIVNLNEIDIDNLTKLQSQIINGVDYTKPEVGKYWKERLGVNLIRERLSSNILIYILSKSKFGGKFKISKNFIGECWVEDCRKPFDNDIICDKCSFTCKDYTFLNKLSSIDKNSVSCISRPFSSILDTY